MIIYTVKSGDSVYSIARQYGTTPARIIETNDIKDPSQLVVGETLIIVEPVLTYTVKSGDTIESISTRLGISKNQIWQDNPYLKGSSNLIPGQVLILDRMQPPYGEISTNGYAYPFIDETVLRTTLPYLTYLSIFTYGINEDGTLIPPLGGDEQLISIAREYDTIPMMMLTSLSSTGNFSAQLAGKVLSDPVLFEKVATEAARTVREKGYGGIDLDFEYIAAEYADDYPRFITRLKELLPEEEGYRVFVSLAPKTSANQPGLLYEGHDYRALGEAADKTMLMTYEWGYKYGPPMPVQPINSARQVIQYALTEIPSEKILFGVPNYAYDWALPYIRGESVAKSLSNTEARDLAKEKNAQIMYDEETQTPYFTYYEQDPASGIAREHIVWFDNARSMAAKLRLIDEYNLDGAGVWNIMNFFPALWVVLSGLYNIRKEI